MHTGRTTFVSVVILNQTQIKIMETKLKEARSVKMVLLIMASALVIFTGSCKKTNSDVTNITGTYAGTLSESFYSEADTIVVTSGSTASTVVLVSHTGVGSTYSMNATVSGNSLTIPSQSVYVNSLNTTYTVTGGGSLTNTNHLALTYLFVSPSNVNYNWSFTGNK